MLNKIKQRKGFVRKLVLAFIIGLLLSSLSCGKRKPPLPPTEKVAQRVDIFGTQQGNFVKLSWKIPVEKISQDSLFYVKSADVYRLAESADAPLTLSEEEFASRSTLISTIPISEASRLGEQVTFTDKLELAGQSARLRYAVRFVNNFGQKAAFSNFLLIEPTIKVSEKPASLSVNISEQAVQVDWTAPNRNADGSEPANILGYNIYRSDDKTATAKLLNKTPLSNTKFADESFEFGVRYRYFVRTVSLANNGEPIESLDSDIIAVLPVDNFAPGAPTAISIAAALKNLSIFFALNPEKDVVGYKIYRSTNPEQPKSVWLLLTSPILTANTFQDINVESGKTYYYYLIAVDNAGNISEPSEVVSETVP